MVIEKKYHFYTAHRNKLAGEKCGRIHGHTYMVTCHFRFDKLVNGITTLFSDIDEAVEPIIKQFDHYFILHKEDSLCEVLTTAKEEFIEVPFETSAENLAMYFFNQIFINTYLPIFKIELAETLSSNVVYEP